MIGAFPEDTMQKVLLGAAALLLVSGCSTSAVNMSEARPVAAEFVYSNQAPSKAGDARVVVVRDSGFVGGGCRFGIFVDGRRVADLARMETVTVYVSPGVRNIGAGAAANASGLCNYNNGRERETTLTSGDERHFRLSLSAAGDLDISPVSKPSGQP